MDNAVAAKTRTATNHRTAAKSGAATKTRTAAASGTALLAGQEPTAGQDPPAGHSTTAEMAAHLSALLFDDSHHHSTHPNSHNTTHNSPSTCTRDGSSGDDSSSNGNSHGSDNGGSSSGSGDSSSGRGDGGDGGGHAHALWRQLVSRKEFTYTPGLDHTQRTAQSYQRLRLVNDLVDATALARDPARLAALHEWIGFADGGLCTLASIHYNLFLGSLIDHDNPDHPRDLTDYTTLRRTGTFLCTELDHGNDAAALETTAHHNPATGGFTLHTPTPGAAKFMPNTSTTGGPKTGLVAARLITHNQDHGVFLFLTPLSDENGLLPGITVTPLPPSNGPTIDHSLTTFHHVPLPREALLEADHGRLNPDGTLTTNLGNPRKRFLTSINRVTTGKLCMSAGCLGMARAALAIAVQYAHTRHTSGPRPGQRIPLAHHHTHHSRLLDKIATAYALTFLHRTTLTQYLNHTHENRTQTERHIAITKAFITWQARDITTESRERCGAQGLFPHNGIADLTHNIEGGITAEGDNLVIWTKAAAEMILHHTPQPTH
ncbi:acyl-CoA dehydrogenase family protein, partial [Streptomyces aurantiacus]